MDKTKLSAAASKSGGAAKAKQVSVQSNVLFLYYMNKFK